MTAREGLRCDSNERLLALEAVLREVGFKGDLETGIGARQVAATDNSIYEVVPAAVVYPRDENDLNRIVRAATAADFSLTARGGNTGTNGQSLNMGIIVDFARYMNRILDIDVAECRVAVQPGVVLSQLNAELARHGLFFPPTVSTASRATIGGMVGTDASGKGSRLYGKTSDYIEALDVVLADGSDWRCVAMSRADANAIAEGGGLIAAIHRETLRIVTERADTIAAIFPDMNRGLTGYNLQQAYDATVDRFSLAYLLAGSEGTLALTKAITLRIARQPTRRALVVIRYDDFQAALVDVERLLESDPLAVEILDDKILGVATSDIIWTSLEHVLGETARPVKALNFVEFVGFSDDAVQAGVERLQALGGSASSALIDLSVIHDPVTVAQLWTLREKAVGLLARLGGGRQGTPFVEDTAVPPRNLAAYVREFRELLDARDLQYGMFGHADVGCLHVRPFLDMKDPEQAGLIRPISDQVAELTKRHGGLLWGEHGRGYRGEYSSSFFGPELYEELTRIKVIFDPEDRFNPGKLASPAGGQGVEKIDEVVLRGERDSLIAGPLMAEFDRAVACNGNAACFSWDALDTMCPSYKATRDRAQSPKGRAALLRAWARLQSTDANAAERDEIEQATKASLATCLSCKACTTLCPVNVDVPAMKSRFLAHYHDRHARPTRDHLLRHAETLFAIGRRYPALANALLRTRALAELARHLTGLVDLPALSALAEVSTLPIARASRIESLSREQRARALVLVEDSFTATFDRRVQRAAERVLAHLGYTVFRLPAKNNGKILHLLGMRRRFARVARRRMAECVELAATGVRLVGLDAATSLMFEQEYREFVPHVAVTIAGLEGLLLEDIEQGRLSPTGDQSTQAVVRLFGHCTESALRPQALAQWVRVLNHFGVTASPVRSGCCGMAGLFGHEQDKAALSRQLFELGWREVVANDPASVVATGYSCREQTERFVGVRPPHPIEVISRHLFQRDAA